MEHLTEHDQELVRRAMAAMSNAQGILDFTTSFLRDKYKLVDGDRIMPDGTIERANQMSLESAIHLPY